MFIISKDFHFSASHIIDGLPEGHPCGRLHGHNYVVTIVLADLHLDDIGMVVDYGELNEFKELLDTAIDHRHLNEVMRTSATTAENIASYLYAACLAFRWGDKVVAVKVKETAKTLAIYVPEKARNRLGGSLFGGLF